MEKKLTDEEIVKALERCGDIDNCYDCPIMGEMERRNCMCQEVVLDLIHRLQDDYSKLKERYIKVLDLNEKVIAEQKAEIERLSEENENLKADILRYEDMEFTEKHCDLYGENETLKHWLKRLNAENEALQKQVDELKLELQGQFDKGVKAGCLMSKVKEQQAVKDTAKEICKAIHKDLQAALFNLKHFITDSEGQKAQEQQNIGIIKAQDAVSEFEKTIKERYGVEVE